MTKKKKRKKSGWQKRKGTFAFGKKIAIKDPLIIPTYNFKKNHNVV